jgi:hypothetical protein
VLAQPALDCDVVEGESHVPNDRLGDFLGGERRALAERGVQSGTQHSDVDEIVEMPGLERGVLAAIGEGEQFVAAAECAGVAQERDRQHRRCRAASLAGQVSQSLVLSLADTVPGAALQAEPEPLGLEPGGQSTLGLAFGQPPVGENPDRSRDAVAPRVSEPAARIAPVIGEPLLRPIGHGFGEDEIAGDYIGVVQRRAGRVGLEAVATDQHAVVLLPANAAEGERQAQVLAAGARLGREAALAGWFERGVERVALRDELVKLEREERLPGGIAPAAPEFQEFLEPGAAGLGSQAGLRGEVAGDRAQGSGSAPAEGPVRLGLDSQGVLQPAGERVCPQRVWILGQGVRDGLRQFVRAGQRSHRDRLQRLLDDVFRRDRVAEEAGGEIGHHLTPFGCGGLAVGDQRGTGADVDDRGTVQSGAETADEESDIGALATAVGVELVENEEEGDAGVRSRCDERCVLGAVEQEFGHDVVGEEEMGWIAADRLAFLVGRLPSVAGETEREGSPGPFLVAFLQLLEVVVLRVDEGVHRVDDQGDGAGLIGVPSDQVDDGDEVAVALAGAGAGGDDDTAPLPEGADGLDLVGVEVDRLVPGATEDLGGDGMEQSLRGELVDRRLAAVGGGKLDERLGPEVLLVLEEAMDLGLDTRVAGDDEGADEVLVVLHDAAVELEDGRHGISP